MKKTKRVSKKNEECDESFSSSSCCSSKGGKGAGCGGCFYGLGFLGSVVYYISTATSFGMGFIGVLKSIVWPAFLIFELMKFIGM